MSENENLKRLNEISSVVSERDMKVWENVAHSVCVKKQTEMLKTEIARMKTATTQKKKENNLITEQLKELTNTFDVQRQTLKASELSVVMQKAFKETLAQEASDFRNKYSDTLGMYNDELQAYRSVYENASQTYKELKSLTTNFKKLEISNMLLDAKISSLENGQQLHKKIQEDMFHKTMVRFAEFVTFSHKRENVRMHLKEKKKEEQQLLKEHLKLAEALKQKKRAQINPIKTVSNGVSKETKAANQTMECAEDRNEMALDKFQKYLNEEILPCSLTSIGMRDRVPSFNKDNSKVKILDMKVMRPPPSNKKPNLDLRKKMEGIMQEAKKEARRTNSFQASRLGSQGLTPASQQIKKTATPSGSQSSQNSNQNLPLNLQESQRKTSSQIVGSQIKSTTSLGSQETKRVVTGSQQKELKETSKALPPKESSLASEAAKIKPKETVTSSILKPLSQEKCDKQENVSKFFNTKKKSVTFQNEVKTDVSQGRFQASQDRFQLFASEEKKTESGSIVKNMDIFQKPFFFKNEALQKFDDKNKKESVLSLPENERDTDEATGTNVSFTMESGPTTFGTNDTNEKQKEMIFDLLETSFNRGFGLPHPDPAENVSSGENPTFNFFGSQAKSNNPFSIF